MVGIKNRRMDAVIVYIGFLNELDCRLIRDLTKDAEIWCLLGKKRLKVEPPILDEGSETFSFMSSSISSERRSEKTNRKSS